MKASNDNSHSTAAPASAWQRTRFFAEDTLSRRLPGIARSLLDEPWHPQARAPAASPGR